jgi:hypothetical protein
VVVNPRLMSDCHSHVAAVTGTSRNHAPGFIHGDRGNCGIPATLIADLAVTAS